MPSGKLPANPRVEAARRALRRYIGSHRGKQTELRRLSGVPQYTISRFLTGRTRKLSPEIARVCHYAGIETNFVQERPEEGIRLTTAISRIWDGTAADAELIASILDSLG